MVSTSQRLAVAIMCLSVMCLAQPRTNFNRIFGPTYGKRSQTGMRPQHYLNLMDGAEGSEEFEREPVENLMAGYLARLSPGKRHMLSKLLEVARMDNELSDE
ncbi:uncharacterized protein LOC110977375 isoform X2 [Acanthaster planci]|uniref:Uncharacterized protein LOC110977375 isoform X2 n=1 Tax=Acanthaster planci TaxID=133434 RepID=A0A8B7Y3L7_ACAPL|nr:uncharacterized protein LOC110977375 isoform X2 [Acanthaster planci]